MARHGWTLSFVVEPLFFFQACLPCFPSSVPPWHPLVAPWTSNLSKFSSASTNLTPNSRLIRWTGWWNTKSLIPQAFPFHFPFSLTRTTARFSSKKSQTTHASHAFFPCVTSISLVPGGCVLVPRATFSGNGHLISTWGIWRTIKPSNKPSQQRQNNPGNTDQAGNQEILARF